MTEILFKRVLSHKSLVHLFKIKWDIKKENIKTKYGKNILKWRRFFFFGSFSSQLHCTLLSLFRNVTLFCLGTSPILKQENA